MNSLLQQRLNRLMWLFLEKFGLILLSIVSFFAYTLLLTPSQLGLAVLLLAIAELFSFFFSSTIENSMIAMKEINQSDDGTVFWTGFISTSLLAAILWLVLSTYYFQEAEWLLLMVALLFMPLQSISRVHVIHMRREGKFKSLARRTLFGRFAGLIFGIYLAYQGYGAWAVVSQAIVMSFVSASLLMLSSWRPLPFTFDLHLIKSLSKTGIPAAIKSMSTNFVEKGLIFVLELYLGTTAVGFFNFAIRLVQLPRMAINNALMAYGHPVFSRKVSVVKGRDDSFSSFFLEATQLGIYLAAPLFIGFAVLGDNLVELIFPEHWMTAAPLIMPISLLAATSFCFTFLPSILVAKNETKKALLSEIATTILAILFVAFTADRLGLMSAVWALIFKSLIMIPVNVVVIAKVCSFDASRYLLKIGRPLIANIVLFGALAMCEQFQLAQNWLELILTTIFGGLIYLLSVFIVDAKIAQKLKGFLSNS